MAAVAAAKADKAASVAETAVAAAATAAATHVLAAAYVTKGTCGNNKNLLVNDAGTSTAVGLAATSGGNCSCSQLVGAGGCMLVADCWLLLLF